ncbi:hypothetical protein ElyMa_005727400 [Elysia marginata]|uniref:Uncharacterized protein n=1 Tax=Elysia marginata TaxID=1093978 RepID=A0AAV4FJY3_9GAST|nr:hypothetical protein ElyMa_005727400 [Elysia marginata]
MSKEGDIDLTVWVQSSESPLNSDTSSGDSPRGGFGDLTIIANSNGDNIGDEDVEEDGEEGGGMAERDPTKDSFVSKYSVMNIEGGGGDGGGVYTDGGSSGHAAGVSSSVDDELLQRLASRHDEFLSTVVSNALLSEITGIHRGLHGGVQ